MFDTFHHLAEGRVRQDNGCAQPRCRVGTRWTRLHSWSISIHRRVPRLGSILESPGPRSLSQRKLPASVRYLRLLATTALLLRLSTPRPTQSPLRSQRHEQPISSSYRADLRFWIFGLFPLRTTSPGSPAHQRVSCICGAPPRGTLANEAETALKGQGLSFAPVRIGHRAAFVHAVTAGQGVQEYEPRGKAASEITRLYSLGARTRKPQIDLPDRNGNLRMAKRSLTDAFAQEKARPAPSAAPSSTVDPPRYRPPSRRGLRAMTVYVDPAVHRQLRLMGIELERSAQEMVSEAIGDFFVKNGKARLVG